MLAMPAIGISLNFDFDTAESLQKNTRQIVLAYLSYVTHFWLTFVGIIVIESFIVCGR